METTLKKRFTESEMGKLFMHNGALTVKWYKCIGEFSETEKNTYEILFRHSEGTPPSDANIQKILSLKESENGENN